MTVATSKQSGAGSAGPRRRPAAVDLALLSQVAGRITALEIQARSPERRSVYIDGQFVLGLHQETAALLRLKVGLQVEGRLLVQALELDLEKKAWDSALLFLTVQARSRREVERRLARYYPAEIAARVVERLAGGGWLDDADFARRYVDSHAGQGERRLLQDLARRGVERTVALAAVKAALGEIDAVAVAREAAAKRLRSMTGVDRETARRRLAGFLARRGYEFDTVQAALAPLLQDLPPAPRKEGRRGFGLRRSRWEEE